MRLDDVTVLDLTRLLPGPYATQLLADMGADVLKVEEPGTGDYARFMAATDGGAGTFAAVNRGKRSVTLDLKREGAREAFYRLLEGADVVVEGFRPGVTDRLGVGPDDVREREPGVVYVSLSGFGATGPNRDRAGHDLNYVAMAGLLDMTRPAPDAAPTIPGYPVADMAGGLFAALSTVSALLARELGDGTGDFVDVSMTDVVTALSQPVAGEALAGGDPRAGETPLTGLYPCYDVYETADGGHVTLAALEPAFWQAFCEAVGVEEHVGHHLADDPETRETVRAAVAEAFRERTREEWEDLLGGEDVMVAPVRSVAEALDSDQVRERGLVDESGPAPRVGFPAIPARGLGGAGQTVPDLGEHTEEVLREVGYDEGEIAELREEGAV